MRHRLEIGVPGDETATRRRSAARRLARWLGVALAVASTSCAPIRPWQRGALANRCMSVDLAREREAARQHVLSVREGATSSEGARGGGCGCD